MKKTLIATGLILCSAAATANECNVSVEGNLSLIDNVLTVTTENDDVIRIVEGEALYVNGSEVTLNNEEYNWMSSYYEGINAAVPAVADIAMDGIAIANVAVSEVFGNLLGNNSDAVDKLSYKLDEMRDKIQYKFYADDGSIHLESTNFSDNEMFGADWEQDFEETIEEVVASSMGHLMIAIGTQLLFNGGDTDNFEAKMENFAMEIEEKIEYQAAELEVKADALCSQLAGIDYAENNLQASVTELADLDIIQVDKKHLRK